MKNTSPHPRILLHPALRGHRRVSRSPLSRAEQYVLWRIIAAVLIAFLLGLALGLAVGFIVG